MSDHTWEDHVEPAFSATEWVLERLLDTLQSLVDNELEEHGEFEVAVEDVKEMIKDLQRLRDNCYNRREGDYQEYEEDEPGPASEWGIDPERAPVEEIAEVDVQKIMKEQGLKDVDGVHYREEAYTGAKAELMAQHEVVISDYLNGKESWEMVLERVEKIDGLVTYLLKEKHGPTAVRLKLGKYAFLFYNPRTNLMGAFTLLDEVRVDRIGRPNRIVAEWRGLKFPGSPGVVRIYADNAVVANKDCTHFSQLISLLEDLPPDFLAEEIHAKWHPPKTLQESIEEIKYDDPE
jgi:hypothetical protein